jgi:cytochrome bd-type quinol oxidase subunit 2
MHLSFSNLLAIIAAIAFMILAMVVYVRNRQGDQRMIQTTNQMLLPILSIVLITLSVIYSGSQNAGCIGIANTVKNIGVFGALLLIVAGVVRYLLSRSRDRRIIMHPILFAVIILCGVFIAQQLFGCM